MHSRTRYDGGVDASEQLMVLQVLVKRYMRDGDLYVHADLHGASSCIIKNPTKKRTFGQSNARGLC